MFGGSRDSCRMPVDPAAEQLSYIPSTLFVSDPSAPEQVGSPDKQNGGTCQQDDLVAANFKLLQQKLQDDLLELGQKLKHHEENVEYLKTLKSNLDESVLHMQVALRKYGNGSFFQTEKEDPEHVKSEEETIENILKHGNSGAAILCRMKIQAEALSSHQLFTKDVIGIVASLGKVDDDILSRLLSEYLGLETMLAVVCKTYEGVKDLEAYNREGSIEKSLGLHGYAASIGRTLNDRFLVICLKDIRPYAGEFVADDPQRRLALPKPRLPNGETPIGFLGFAVNMIIINRGNLHFTSKNGGSLRETLFYQLFSKLQVYRSREDMIRALTCITYGAISLDGGMIRSPGVFSLGRHEGDIGVKFPTGSERLNLSEGYVETENGIKETKWKRDRTCEDIKREQVLLDCARLSYEKKKQELIQFLAKSSYHASQYPVGSQSTPRELRSWKSFTKLNN